MANNCVYHIRIINLLKLIAKSDSIFFSSCLPHSFLPIASIFSCFDDFCFYISRRTPEKVISSSPKGLSCLYSYVISIFECFLRISIRISLPTSLPLPSKILFYDCFLVIWRLVRIWLGSIVQFIFLLILWIGDDSLKECPSNKDHNSISYQWWDSVLTSKSLWRIISYQRISRMFNWPNGIFFQVLWGGLEAAISSSITWFLFWHLLVRSTRI